MEFQPTGPEAARLRRRKAQLLRQFKLPSEPLPGSLSLSHRRCGKPTCHCASGEGHPVWQLTFMVDRKKRVESVPQEWVEDVRALVDAGREFKQAMAEVFAINAQLLALGRKQRRR